MKNIVAVNGTIGSGKDTVSSIFIESGYVQVSFADVLKDVLSVLFGWDRIMLEGKTEESRQWRTECDVFWSSKLKRQITPRMMLQEIGTDLFRNHFNENIWLWCLENTINNINADKLIISDCRFENEINMARSLGATMIEVRRVLPSWYESAKHYNTGQLSKLPSELRDVHASEYSWVGINNPDYIIDNTKTLSELNTVVCDIINQLKI